MRLLILVVIVDNEKFPNSLENWGSSEPTVQAAKLKKGAKKTAASAESSVINENKKKGVETARTVTKKREEQLTNEAAEEPKREVATQKEHQNMKVSTRGAKAAEMKEHMNSEAIPEEENKVEMPENKKKKGGSGTGRMKKRAKAET
uniref:Uncharacterized protein n=1 Tax=Parascaris equorum TaxID=6256 RepID=A0A914R1G0_PAREQ